MKLKTTFLLLFVVYFVPTCIGAKTKHGRHIFRASKPDNVMDVTDFSVYYDIETNETIRKMMPRPWYKPGWLLRFPFRGGRCNCEGFKCTCCTGVRIPAFNFDRKTCTILTYEPEESMLDMQVMMNNETVFKNNYSARNPPPFCVPIPIPYLPPGLVDMCIRLFDINIIGQRLHVCMDMDTRVDKAPVIVLHFDCMDMGFDGVGLSKPGGSSSNISNDAAGSTTTPEPTQVAYDIYDTVTEVYTTTEVLFNNTVKYI